MPRYVRSLTSLIKINIIVYALIPQAADALKCGDVVQFENGIPVGFHTSDYVGNGVAWRTSGTIACGVSNQTGESGEAACIDARGRPSTWSGLTSSTFSLQGVTSAVLEFYGAMDHRDSNDYFVLWSWTSTLGFQHRLVWQEDHSSEFVSVNLEELIGEAVVAIEFAYSSDADGGWLQVDAVHLNCSGSSPSTISGHVIDGETGVPIGSTSIVVRDMNYGSWGFGVTSEQGAYEISVAPGDYLVGTSTNNYADKIFEDISCPLSFLCNQAEGTMLSVSEGSSIANINFTLNAGGFISGSVTDANTGEPILDAFVSIEVPGLELKSSGVLVNESGSYQIGALPTGEYIARAQSLSGKYVTQYYRSISCPDFECPSNPDLIPVAAPGISSGVDFALEPAPIVIFEDDFESGTADAWSRTVQ